MRIKSDSSNNTTSAGIGGPGWRCRPRLATTFGDESGSTALYFVVIASAMIFAAAVVIDGGRKMSSLSEAVHLADNGARACAQAVDEQAILSSNRGETPTLNQDAARSAAAQYFLQADVATYQVAFNSTGTQCLVTVTLDVPTMALPLGNVTATQSATGQAG